MFKTCNPHPYSAELHLGRWEARGAWEWKEATGVEGPGDKVDHAGRWQDRGKAVQVDSPIRLTLG